MSRLDTMARFELPDYEDEYDYEPLCFCSNCGDPIYEDNTVRHSEIGIICEICAEEEYKESLFTIDRDYL